MSSRPPVSPRCVYVTDYAFPAGSEVENHLEMGRDFLARGQLQDALSHYHAAVGKLIYTTAQLNCNLFIKYQLFSKSNKTRVAHSFCFSNFRIVCIILYYSCYPSFPKTIIFMFQCFASTQLLVMHFSSNNLDVVITYQNITFIVLCVNYYYHKCNLIFINFNIN